MEGLRFSSSLPLREGRLWLTGFHNFLSFFYVFGRTSYDKASFSTKKHSYDIICMGPGSEPGRFHKGVGLPAGHTGCTTFSSN